MGEHVAKTLLNDRVILHKDGKAYAGIVVAVHEADPHCACITYFCPETGTPLFAKMVKFTGHETEGQPFFCNA